jgi:hypothetical protein
MTQAELDDLKVDTINELLRLVLADIYEELGGLVPATDDEVQFLNDLLQTLRSNPHLVEQLNAAMAATQEAQRRAERQAKRAARRTNRKHRVTNELTASD